MAFLPETSSWDSVFQLETNTPAQGGPGGLANLPAQGLTNRTAWLKDQLEAASEDFDDFVLAVAAAAGKKSYSSFVTQQLNASGTVQTFNVAGVDFGKFINVTYNGAIGGQANLASLATLSAYTKGHHVAFQNVYALGGTDFPLIIHPFAGDGFYDRDGSSNAHSTADIVLNAGEMVEIILGEDFAGQACWYVGDRYFKDQAFKPGMVQGFANSTPPVGWLECDGSAVSRTLYAKLFATIGTTYGTGNGTTTFNIPNFRGMFLRGLNSSGSGTDASRSLGVLQNGVVAAHLHSYMKPVDTLVGIQTGATPFLAIVPTADNVDPNVGSENRPVNMAVMYCIKYK